MPKYLFEARYSPEGAIGLAKEGGTGRRDAVKKHLEDVGGKLESMYFAFGDVDCFVIVDLPDNVSAAALSLAVNESGMIASKAIVLLTPEEMDQAGKKKVHFRAPGKKSPSLTRFQRAGASCYGGALQAPVAQLDRVSVFETEGWRFEPVRARQQIPIEITNVLDVPTERREVRKGTKRRAKSREAC